MDVEDVETDWPPCLKLERRSCDVWQALVAQGRYGEMRRQQIPSPGMAGRPNVAQVATWVVCTIHFSYCQPRAQSFCGPSHFGSAVVPGSSAGVVSQRRP